jgi:predicted Zn-dependent peptidase
MRSIKLLIISVSILLIFPVIFSYLPAVAEPKTPNPVRSVGTNIVLGNNVPTNTSNWVNQTETITIDVKEFVLKNGMKVLVFERYNSPTVAVNIYFRVGSVHEPFCQTGIAHLLEHMLFKGSQTIGTTNYSKESELMKRQDEIIERLEVLRTLKALQDKEGKDIPTLEDQEIKILEDELKSLNDSYQSYISPKEYTQIYTKHGSRELNASTSKYHTNYYCRLPANKLELWAWLESDHFINPVLRGFYEERDTVLEERRQRSEDNPNGVLWEEFEALMYKAHPYRRPIIGWRSDIENLKRKQVEEYFRKYYAPNNAIAVIVGAVKSEEVIKLMKRYFEPIPKGSPIPPVITTEPEQFGERRVIVEFDSQPKLVIGYKGTTIAHKDDFTFDIISTILSKGRLSRLYKKLVLDKKMCLDIDVFNSAYQQIGHFVIYAVPQSPYSPEDVEKAVYEELELLKKEPVSDQELQRAKNQLEVSFLRGLNSNDGMARRLGYNEVLSSWRYILDWLPQCKKVTKDDIIKTANEYFMSNRRTVAILIPKKK